MKKDRIEKELRQLGRALYERAHCPDYENLIYITKMWEKDEIFCVLLAMASGWCAYLTDRQNFSLPFERVYGLVKSVTNNAVK